MYRKYNFDLYKIKCINKYILEINNWKKKIKKSLHRKYFFDSISMSATKMCKVAETPKGVVMRRHVSGNLYGVVRIL